MLVSVAFEMSIVLLWRLFPAGGSSSILMSYQDKSAGDATKRSGYSKTVKTIKNTVFFRADCI